MSETIEIPPFVVTIGESDVSFRFDRESLEQGVEYPPDLEGLIGDMVEAHLNLLANRQLIIDLEDLPAISSKQLGAMLAICKACGQDRKIRVLNVRPHVRELLHITKLGGFFEYLFGQIEALIDLDVREGNFGHGRSSTVMISTDAAEESGLSVGDVIATELSNGVTFEATIVGTFAEQALVDRKSVV